MPSALNGRCNTYGGKSHILDIIQVLDDPLPCASTVHLIPGVARRVSCPVCERKPIRKDLVNRL